MSRKNGQIKIETDVADTAPTPANKRGRKKKSETNGQIKIETDVADTAPAPAKKRGRKKKSETVDVKPDLKQGLITDHMPVEKKKRKIDRFNGMPEEEVILKTLPDRLAMDLDILIIGINPGLYAAYIGHHYAGPGNHFWKCLYLSGLVPEPMNCYDDIKIQKYGIGFTNMCARTTHGSADLKKPEIIEGAKILTEKLKEYKPKIAVFNGKGIYEVFSGSKKFKFGKQPGLIEGTQSIAYVMPSSSARCAQLPRAIDKVPFYEALGRLRDYVVGRIAHLDESQVTFPTLELKNVKKEEPQDDDLGSALGVSSGNSSSRVSGECSQQNGTEADTAVNIKQEPDVQKKGSKAKGSKPQGRQNRKKKGDVNEDQKVMAESYQQQISQQQFSQQPQQQQQQQCLPQTSNPSANFLCDGQSVSSYPQLPFMSASFGGTLQPPQSLNQPLSNHAFPFSPPPANNHQNFLSASHLDLPFGTAQFSDFLSSLYSGSEDFGMVGLPSATAFLSSAPSSFPHNSDGGSSKEPNVKIKSEPVDD